MGKVLPIDRSDNTDHGHGAENKSAGWRWLNWAWEQRLGNTTLKSVLVTLAGHANAQGECWPSVSRLCERSDAKVRSVQNALRELERRGLLITIPRSGTSNLYRLTPAGDAPPQEMHPAKNADHPRNKCAPPPQEMHPAPAGDAPKLPRTPNEEPNEDIAPLQAQIAIDQNDFVDRFFAIYPRAGDREKTEDALKKAIGHEGVTPEVILAGAKAYAEEQKGNQVRYIAYSENWVEQMRWRQYATTTKPADPDVVHQQRAKAIRKGQAWIGRHISAAAARELVERELVTVEQCRAVGVML